MSSSSDETRMQIEFDDSAETPRIEEIVRGLRDTLTDGMAIKAYRLRHKREPTSAELSEFKTCLINEHYDEGFDSWVEKYLYYDPST